MIGADIRTGFAMGQPPNPIMGIASVGASTTRRWILKLAAASVTPDAIFKVVSHLAAGGVGYGTSHLPWFQSLGKGDLTTEADSSTVQISRRNNSNLVFTVVRLFTLQAQRSGNYTFKNCSPGVIWGRDNCTITLKHRTPSSALQTTTSKLYVGPPDEQDHCGAPRIVRSDKMSLTKGDLLEISLESNEEYHSSRQFYSYRVSGSIGDLKLKWTADPVDLVSALHLNASFYSEKENAVLEDLLPGSEKTDASLSEGFNLLLSWKNA